MPVCRPPARCLRFPAQTVLTERCQQTQVLCSQSFRRGCGASGMAATGNTASLGLACSQRNVLCEWQIKSAQRRASCFPAPCLRFCALTCGVFSVFLKHSQAQPAGSLGGWIYPLPARPDAKEGCKWGPHCHVSTSDPARLQAYLSERGQWKGIASQCNRQGQEPGGLVCAWLGKQCCLWDSGCKELWAGGSAQPLGPEREEALLDKPRNWNQGRAHLGSLVASISHTRKRRRVLPSRMDPANVVSSGGSPP